MRGLGLDGRVILPLIMGFGCNLPALAAVRSLPSRRQRLVTVLITPYTSCAARLTIYLMIARIFFPGNAGTVIFVMYLLSILMVVLGALVLRPFFGGKESAARRTASASHPALHCAPHLVVREGRGKDYRCHDHGRLAAGCHSHVGRSRLR